MRRRRHRWLVAAWLAVWAVAAALAAPAAADPEDPASAPVLTVEGLEDGQVIKDRIQFTVQVDAETRSVTGYTMLSPWENGTSYGLGTWTPRGAVVKVDLNTHLLPDGLHMVVFFSKDHSGRFRAMRAFSVVVANSARTPVDPATHIEIGSPAHLATVSVEPIDVVDHGTGKVAYLTYEVIRLGDRRLEWRRSLPEAFFDLPDLQPGPYAIVVSAYNLAGQLIDMSVVTVWIGGGT